MCDMVFLKVLSYSIIFIVAAVPFIDAFFYPPHYNIHFVLYVNASIFHGEYNTSIYISHETQDIYFSTENLFIIKAIVTNNTQIPKGNEKKVFTHRPKKYIYDTETYVTAISFPYNLSSGNYTLNIKFSGRLTEDGGFRIYKNEQNERIWLAATHYHTFATRRLLPVLKDTLYANYNISIKHHKNYTALSNMPVQEINMDENNMQWTRFKPAPMMPVYFITASVAHFAVIPGSQITKLWCRTGVIPHVQFASTVAINIAQYLDKIFPYIRESPETNHVVIPNFHYVLTKENIKFGFVLYGEEDIIFNQETDSEIRKIDITRVIGYKVIHEWFYNAIDPSMWEPWLSKGFATFFGIFVADKTFPDLRLQDFFAVQMQHEFLHWSTKDIWPLTFGSGYNSIEIPDYIKASIMFRTFHIIFTEEMFQSGMSWFLRVHYISSTNFWDVMQLIMDKSDLEIKYNITDRIASWTQLNHYPVINVERNYNINWLNISVENLNNFVTWIFVNITTQTYPYSKKFLPEVWLSSQSMSYKLNIDFVGKNDWILVNSQQSGCFRVNYDAENWNRLSNYLNSSFEKIHVLDRAKLIDDSFHFLMTGRLNYTVFLNISHYLSRDTDYISWYPMFKNLEYMSGFFAFPESAFIKAEIIQFMKVILRELEYPTFDQDEKNYGNIFITCLREDAAKWLCIMNYQSCLTISNVELKSYLSNRKTSSAYEIWPEWKEWTFCNGLKEGNKYIWREVFRMYWTKSDESVLKFLACSMKSGLIKKYMHLMKFGVVVKKIKNLHHINSFCNIIARHAKNDSMLNIILNNLEDIKPGQISITTALTIIINHIYSKEQIDKVNKYLDEHKENITINVKRKLELRWTQIKIQLFTFRYLAKSLDDILIEEWMYHLTSNY